MGFVSTSGATGQGSLSLGGVQTVNEVAAHLEVQATEARVVGVSPVRRVWKQAFYCIGLTPTGGPLTGIFIVTAAFYLQVECESRAFANNDLRPADTLFYDVGPGGQMYFEVDWP